MNGFRNYGRVVVMILAVMMLAACATADTPPPPADEEIHCSSIPYHGCEYGCEDLTDEYVIGYAGNHEGAATYRLTLGGAIASTAQTIELPQYPQPVVVIFRNSKSIPLPTIPTAGQAHWVIANYVDMATAIAAVLAPDGGGFPSITKDGPNRAVVLHWESCWTVTAGSPQVTNRRRAAGR